MNAVVKACLERQVRRPLKLLAQRCRAVSPQRGVVRVGIYPGADDADHLPYCGPQ